MKKIFILCLFFLACQKPHGNPQLFVYSPENLEIVKSAYLQGDSLIHSAMDDLISECEQAVESGTFSVMNKSVVPPSGNKHDYYSFGPYWWPDTTKPDGLPYVRRDGQRNPETRSAKFDRQAMRLMVRSVVPLALGYYYTGEERYAEHAVDVLRTWFTDPETRMNPHLKYAQAIPGRVEGRGIGIIETAELIYVIDAIGLLRTSRYFMEQDDRELKSWFKDYLYWLMHSENGLEDADWHNNHGTWYDVQIVDFALYTGQDSLAHQVCLQSKTRRIQSQIEPDGSQPFELERTRSMHYSLFNLDGFFQLAQLAGHVDVELWYYQTQDSAGIKKALDFLLPYFQDKTWPYTQITPMHKEYDILEKLLRTAHLKFQDKKYLDLLRQMSLLHPADRLTLLYPVL